MRFWEEGDPNSEWHEITEEDMIVAVSRNLDPLPIGGVMKRPPIKQKHPY